MPEPRTIAGEEKDCFGAAMVAIRAILSDPQGRNGREARQGPLLRFAFSFGEAVTGWMWPMRKRIVLRFRAIRSRARFGVKRGFERESAQASERATRRG